jgi:3',5'-cyclic AMP phosphodiesterase CpdA
MNVPVHRPALAAVAAAAALGALAALPAHAQFRVQPYLQAPSSTGMTVTWFTTEPVAGTLTLIGPAPVKRRVYTTLPAFQPVLAYTAAEKVQSISGLPPGSWLLPDANHKHSVVLANLEPGTTYAYVVRQGSETFRGTLATAPTAEDWQRIRFVAMSDSETEPAGRAARREWAPGALAEGSLPRPAATPDSAWVQRFGSRTLSGVAVLNYALTEDEGYRRNLEIVASRRPDFVLMPGDLVQGGGYQPGWDEFWRQNAGEVGSGFSRWPVLPALGNWENFGALNGGYGVDAEGRFGPKFGRDKYHVYFDAPDNGTPAHRDNYYRIDYGPVTVLTLDSSNGEPDDTPANHAVKLTGTAYEGPGTDTQNNFTRVQYEGFGGTDLSDFNPGSAQWAWAEAQLADARAKGRIVFVQFHHAPYSSGEHGQPMNHALTTGQGGTPMRQYQPLFERYGVSAVLSGHSEMFERSFVDEDGDGLGVHYYDVGVSGDGLRGSKRSGSSLNDPLLNYNPASVWTADQSAAERWAEVDGTVQLVEGGKHYGHLEVNVVKSRRTGELARVHFTPVKSFPVLDAAYGLVRTERRTYDDAFTLIIGSDGRPKPAGGTER